MRPGADIRLRPGTLRAPQGPKQATRGGRLVLTGLAAALFFCASLSACRPALPVVTVGCQDTPEQLIIGNLAALVTEANPKVEVARRFGMEGPAACFAALRKGEIGVCAEYTHTVLTEFLRQPAKRDPQAVYERVESLLDARHRLTCFPPLGFANGRTLLMRAEAAQKKRIKAISDLRTHRRELRSAFTPEFLDEENGYPAMCAAYGFSFALPPRRMSQRSLYWTLGEDKTDVVSGFAMDAAISTGKLVVLEDDLNLFPSGDACLIIRRALLEREPSLDFTLRKLSHALDSKTMRSLKARVRYTGADPAQVARSFLRARGILR